MTHNEKMTLVNCIRAAGNKYRPNDWEESFLLNISRSGNPLTPKQDAALIKIYEKSCGHGKYQRREII